MFSFLFFDRDDPNGKYHYGELKPRYAVTALIIIFLAGGYLEGLDHAAGF